MGSRGPEFAILVRLAGVAHEVAELLVDRPQVAYSPEAWGFGPHPQATVRAQHPRSRADAGFIVGAFNHRKQWPPTRQIDPHFRWQIGPAGNLVPLPVVDRTYRKFGYTAIFLYPGWLPTLLPKKNKQKWKRSSLVDAYSSLRKLFVKQLVISDGCFDFCAVIWKLRSGDIPPRESRLHIFLARLNNNDPDSGLYIPGR